MATLTQRVLDLATATGTKLKELHTKTGNLASLTTAQKTDIVGAINELDAAIDALIASSGAQIDDAASVAADKTWSINKIKVELQATKDAILGGASAAFDTLSELAAALGNDSNLAATLSADIGKRVRFDAAQTLTAGEKTQAQANMDAQSKTEVGFTDNNFVTALTTAMA